MSVPIRFAYGGFDTVDRLFCKYDGSSISIAGIVTTQQSGGKKKVLTSFDPRFVINNSTLHSSGYFGISIHVDVNRDDGQNLMCEFSSPDNIGFSSLVNLFVTAIASIEVFSHPLSPTSGDRVEVGCIVSGYPFPTVEIITPRGVSYQSVQISSDNTKLTQFKYFIVIQKADESWNNEKLICSAFQTTGQNVERTVVIKLNEFSLTSENSTIVIAIVVGVVGTTVLVVAVVFTIVLVYFKRKRKDGKMNGNRYAPSSSATTFPKPDNFTTIMDTSDIEKQRDGKSTKGGPTKYAKIDFSNTYEVSTAALV